MQGNYYAQQEINQSTDMYCKDLGHFWLGYIRMLGHLQLSAH